MKLNRPVDFEKDYSHYLVWVLLVIVLFFGGGLVFQFMGLISNIRSKQEILWRMDTKLRTQIKVIDEKLSLGESIVSRMFSEGDWKEENISRAWISDVEKMMVTAQEDLQFVSSPYQQRKSNKWNSSKGRLNGLFYEMQSIAQYFDRSNQVKKEIEANSLELQRYVADLDEIVRRMKPLIVEQNGLHRIEDLHTQENNRSTKKDRLQGEVFNKRANYDAFLAEIAELRILLAMLNHSVSPEEVYNSGFNSLEPALARSIQLLQTGNLKEQLSSIYENLYRNIDGGLNHRTGIGVENSVSGIIGAVLHRINLERERSVLHKEVSSRFKMLESSQVELFGSFNRCLFDFQKDIDRQLDKMWRSGVIICLLGVIILFLLTVLISETIRWKTLRLRKMAEELYDQRKLALESVEVKSNFMANMSHEIRTPMNAILGFSDLLSRTKLSGDQKKYLDIVKSSGTLLIGIINDILDVSKLESGNIRLEQIDFSLEEVIKDVFKMVVMRIKDRPFDTYIQIADDVPATVVGDPTRLKQVFVNLLGNAVKFTSSGSVGVIVTRETTDARSGEIALKVAVKDTGIGIPSDKLDAIFEPFTQADESTTRKYGGTGLGLTICKSLIQAMGGKIWVESQIGVGTEFIFTIKLGEVQKTIKPQEPKDNKYAWLAGKTVFIVDDNLIAVKLLVKKCEQMGLRVFGVADSGYNALSKLEKLASTRGVIPDIVFCDIIMGGMSGFEFVRRLKEDEHYKRVKFIAVTADPNAKDPAMSQGKFNAYIVKPVFWDDLGVALEEAFVLQGAGDGKQSAPVEDHASGSRILVAEDTETNIILLEQYFEQFQWKGVFVSSGREAIDFLRKDKDFDLCLMDLQMTDIGGVEATRIIRQEISKELPIIALTASVMEKDFQEAMESGMDGFLNKPVSVSQLKQIVMKYTQRTGKNMKNE